MHEAIAAFLATYAALFPICNPFGNAAIFLSITDGEKTVLRRQQALKGSIYMLAILLAFFVAGNFIMRFFGISLDAVRLAGGLVVARVGLKLLQPKKEDTHQPEEEEEARTKPDISFTPLALPLLAGPGSIAVVMSMSSLQKESLSPGMLGITAGIVAVAVTCWLVLSQAERVIGMLGVNGANALTRIMGFLLICIGVQLMITGAISAVGSVLK